MAFERNGAELKKRIARIKARLPVADESRALCKILPSTVQGIFVREVSGTIELYCYDPATKKLSDIMSRIDLSDPLHLLGTYSQVMMLGSIWNPTPPERIYVAGFGGGRLSMPVHCYFPKCRIDGSDFDPGILKAAERYFGVEFDHRHDIRTSDSAVDLAQRETRYDIIHIDVFSNSGAHPEHLASQDFFKECGRKLKQNGVLAINLVEHDPAIEDKIANLVSTFSHVMECHKNGARILFASHNQPDLKGIRERAVALENSAGIDYPLSEHARDLRQTRTNQRIPKNLV